MTGTHERKNTSVMQKFINEKKKAKAERFCNFSGRVLKVFPSRNARWKVEKIKGKIIISWVAIKDGIKDIININKSMSIFIHKKKSLYNMGHISGHM